MDYYNKIVQKAVIDPSACIYYFSFYIQGLYDVLGKKNVSFSGKYFKGLRRKEGIYAFDSNVCFVLLDQNNQIVKKIAIDYADDSHNINGSAFRWADIYYKVNIDKKYQIYNNGTECIDYSRIHQIPPYMGIRIWGLFETGYYFITNFIKAYNNRPVFFMDYVKDYALQYFHRQPLSRYTTNTDVRKNYIFLACNLWKGSEKLNYMRKKMMEVCKNNTNIEFEGGFVPVREGGIEDFKDLIIEQRYSHKEYLKKMSSSALAFNVPAVLNCHGWKLAEYFCMGKVIISTRFINEIPNGIIDGKNIVFVDEDNIEEKVTKLLNDANFQKLSNGALEYWNHYACPKAVMTQIINDAVL